MIQEFFVCFFSAKFRGSFSKCDDWKQIYFFVEMSHNFVGFPLNSTESSIWAGTSEKIIEFGNVWEGFSENPSPKNSQQPLREAQGILLRLRQCGRDGSRRRTRPSSRLGRRRPGSRRVLASFWQNFGKMLLVFGSIGTDFCN